MGRFDSTKTAIDVNITQNGNQEITGSILNSVLNNMVDATDAQLDILEGAIPTKLSDLEQDIPIGSYDDTELRQELTKLSAETEYIATEVESHNELIEDLQNTKIDKEADDYYPQLAVGLADNLSGVDVVDSEVNFRRSGGGAISDGVARIEAIKGNSVVWNQLIRGTLTSSGNTTITNDGDDWTITPDGENVYPGIKQDNFLVPKEHKYLVVYDTLFEGTLSVGINMCGQSQEKNLTSGGSWISDQRIIKYTAGENKAIILFFRNAKSEIKVRNFIVIDLTQMFGAGNEPTTIEEFYARIPMGVDLNAYNEGEVIHMDVQSVESQGVNAWDEEWENGSFNTNTGTNVNSESTNKQIRSKNRFRVVGGAEYYSNVIDMWAILYDAEGNTISNPHATLATSNKAFYIAGKFKLPINAAYMRFYMLPSYGTIYNNNICINISDTSINGKYFPYIKRTEDLSIIRKYFPQGMKSAGSAHDEIRYNKASGKWEYSKGRLKSVDLGTLNFAYNTLNGGYFYGKLEGAKTPSSWALVGNILSALYSATNGNAIAQSGATPVNMTMAVAPNGTLHIVNTSYTDAASFKAAMQGVILYYEAAEWEWVELDEADQFKDLDYQVWNAGTEKAIAEGKSAPLAADITYGFNAIGKIKELESLVAALRAKVGI